jgi:hypothetical protein
MTMLMRQLLATAALPFTVTVVIPVWIARRNHTVIAEPDRSASRTGGIRAPRTATQQTSLQRRAATSTTATAASERSA